jgi:hypothetical protein
MITELANMLIGIIEALADIHVACEKRLERIHIVLTVKIFAINYPF